MNDIMHNKERMELVYKAMDEVRLDFDEIEEKYPSDDGDGLHGAMRKEKKKATAKCRAHKKFYKRVIEIAEMHFE